MGSENSSGVAGGGGAGGGGVWKSGNLEIQEFGSWNLKIWEPGNPEIWGPKHLKKIKIQIHSAQNVGKVWISKKKILPALFGAI